MVMQNFNKHSKLILRYSMIFTLQQSFSYLFYIELF